MAYELDAVIGAESTIDAVIEDLAEARCVPLAQGVAMIPLTDEFLRELRQGHDAAPVARWARAASRHGLLAHCSAAYTGGLGSQRTVIWRDGAEIERSDSVNRALHLLDVSCGEGEDEWDAVGLGRFRQTDRWLALAKG